MSKKQNSFGVAVKAIIVKDNKYLVLFKSKTEKIAPESYDIPGGRIKFNEELEDALKREVKEETNLEIDIKFPINAWTFNTSDDFQLVGITYLCYFVKGEVKLSSEHFKFEWLTLQELKSKKLPKFFLKEFEIAEKMRKIL